jgi:carboxy-terminal domain RNA polymerase II polypeptide A small phosphatase
MNQLLILDIDETLIHATTSQLPIEPDFTFSKYFVYKRPHLEEFLEECSRLFKLAIWSSATDDYVDEIVKIIIPKHIPLEFAWGRSKCTPKSTNKSEFDNHRDSDSHYNYTKQLKKIKGKGFHLNQTLIVDDTPEKVLDNYGNAIYIKEFLGEKDDTELLLLAQYLKKLVDFENIRKIEKRFWRNQILSIS